MTYCRMPDPTPEVEGEYERLFAEWRLNRSEDNAIDYCSDFGAYCKKHGSKALHDYERMCDEIHASLQPGEYV